MAEDTEDITGRLAAGRAEELGKVALMAFFRAKAALALAKDGLGLATGLPEEAG